MYEYLQPKKEINTHLPKVGHSQRYFVRLKALSLYFPIASPSLSLYIPLPLPLYSAFNFSYSLILSCWLRKRTWHPDMTRWFLWDSSLPSFQLASFLNKVYSLTQPLISWIHWPVMWWAEWAWTQLYEHWWQSLSLVSPNMNIVSILCHNWFSMCFSFPALFPTLVLVTSILKPVTISLLHIS